jgi:acetylornithine deacetylase/succinyl-diaminopimelate desuccinylase-like protein
MHSFILMNSPNVPIVQNLLPYVNEAWQDGITQQIVEYIAIPNVSANFDPNWKANGHMDRAVALVVDWMRTRTVAGSAIEIVELPDRSPMIFVEIPAFGSATPGPAVLLYGHLDKQPEMSGWREGLGPWTPVVEGDRLYGRGGADDGYSSFASLLAIEALQANGGSHRRCVVMIEASEESGSPDLPAYVDHLAARIGDVDLVICLDSGCIDYDRMWVTTSLRGLAGGTLTVRVLEEGVHSGDASGIVPSSFRIARALLDRIENSSTGEILLPELHVDIPTDRREGALLTAAELPEPVSAHYKWAGGTRPMVDDWAAQLLARTWIPTLSIIAADGFPDFGRAGNVLRPFTKLKLSVRLPPTADADAAIRALTKALTTDVPHGAQVTFDDIESADGWNAPSLSPWLAESLDRASEAAFGSSSRTFGEGGSIPFMGMLGQRFPQAQFVVTGVLGPESNAHGPNEYLHLPTARKLTAAMSLILHDHATVAQHP